MIAPRLLVLLQLTLAQGALFGAVPRPEAASAPVPTSMSGASGSYAPVPSGDGRFVVFLSHARNLLPAQEPGIFLNVYLKDLQTGAITLVSQSSAGQSGGNGSSMSPSISSNGQFIAFQSAASNLVANDTNGFTDIFLRDTLTGATILISVDVNGSGSGNGESVHPLISPNGRFIAFESSASNLAPGDTNRLTDVFVRDRIAGTTTRVSVGSLGAPGSSFGSHAQSQLRGMTPDGRRVLFESSATNLVSTPGAGSSEIYVRDLESAVTFWVSSGASAYITAPRHSFNPSISDDGRRVAYKCSTDGAATVCLLAQELSSGVTRILSSNSYAGSAPMFSSKANLVISESAPDGPDFESAWQVTLWDLTVGTNTALVPLVAPSTNSFRPFWAKNGSRVAFFASPGTPEARGKAQLVVHDLDASSNRLMAIDGQPILFNSAMEQLPALSDDGELLVFDLGEDLYLGDRNADWDVMAYSWSADMLDLLSRRATNSNRRTSGNFNFSSPGAVSGDGRYVVWATSVTNSFTSTSNGYPYRLAIWDNSLHQDITAQILTNLMVSDSGASLPSTEFAFSSSSGPSVSGDGSTLSYAATVKIQTHEFPNDLYTLSLKSASVDWISRSFSGAVGSANPSLSWSGRYTTYESGSPNVSGDAPDNNGKVDIFVYDAVAKTNSTVSVNAAGTSTGNGDSTNALISPDGRWVLFQSTATDLVGGLSSFPSGSIQVCIRDLASNITTLVSFGANHAPMPGTPGHMTWSTNSQVAAFAGVYNLNGSGTVPLIMVYDALSRTNRLACTNCQNPSLDGSGCWLAYETVSAPGIASQVFLKNLRSDEQSLISHSANFSGGGNGSSVNPLLSSDARFVVFASKAGDLVANDHNDKSDIFAHDCLLGTTTLLSLNQQGTASGNGVSARPAISADGRTVVFQSLASDLIGGDYSSFRDVFIVRIGSPDSDHDGMDDDWEVAYFGDLSRDGQGDFDGDGQTDLQEFRSGTDPTNQGSILRVITLTRIPSGMATVVWSSVPGKTYRVEYKDDLQSDSWNALSGLVTASSTSSSKQDPQPSPQRFYRVVSTE